MTIYPKKKIINNKAFIIKAKGTFFINKNNKIQYKNVKTILPNIII